MFKVKVIESSSRGNCIIADNGHVLIVLDAGIPVKKVSKYILESNAEKKLLFVSHSHQDHIKYAEQYVFSFGLELINNDEYKLTREKSEYCEYSWLTVNMVHDVVNKALFFVDTKNKDGFCYIIDSNGWRDERIFKLNKIEGIDIDTVIIESNYDYNMLIDNTTRPKEVLMRTLDSHMSNSQMIMFLGKFCTKETKQVIITHLSKENNTTEKVEQALKSFRSGIGTDIAITITNKIEGE